MQKSVPHHPASSAGFATPPGSLIFLEQSPRFVGGSERMSLALCRHAIRRGHSCKLIYAEHGDMVPAYEEAGASTEQLTIVPLAVRKPVEAWHSLRHLLAVVRQRNTSCVFTSQISYVSLLAAVGKLTRVKTAVHLGLPFDFPSPLFGLSMRLVDHGIAPSQHTASSWKKRGWPQKRLQVIANGVDTSVFNPALSRATARQTLGFTNCDGPLIAYVGRVVEAKGVRTLLRAFAQWRQTANCGQLVLTGTCDNRENAALREIASESGLPAASWALQPSTNRPELVYRAADLVVVPSEWDEPFGLVPLEAMACGTLTLVSDRGMLPEFVSPAGNDCVFQAGNVPSLVSRLGFWLADARAREKTAELLRVFVTAKYNLEACGDAYLSTLGLSPQQVP